MSERSKIEELENKIKELETRIGLLEKALPIALFSSGLYVLEKLQKLNNKTEEKHDEKTQQIEVDKK